MPGIQFQRRRAEGNIPQFHLVLPVLFDGHGKFDIPIVRIQPADKSLPRIYPVIVYVSKPVANTPRNQRMFRFVPRVSLFQIGLFSGTGFGKSLKVFILSRLFAYLDIIQLGIPRIFIYDYRTASSWESEIFVYSTASSVNSPQPY